MLKLTEEEKRLLNNYKLKLSQTTFLLRDLEEMEKNLYIADINNAELKEVIQSMIICEKIVRGWDEE